MKRDKNHFRLLLYCFDSKKKTIIEAHRFISETYSESAPSVKTYIYIYIGFDDSKVIILI